MANGVQLQGGMNNFVCYQFEARNRFLGFDRFIGNCDQIHLRVAPSNWGMGKLAVIIPDHIGDTGNLAGRLPFLQREPTGCNSESVSQIRTEQRH